MNRIFGKSFEDHERSGDNFFRDGIWGQAKIEYERALDKLENKAPHEDTDIRRLEDKIGRAREALSLKHKQDGTEMMASGCFE
ncbi:MAG: hypothetical protein JRJ85_08515, partial [Deltaproteobacteria bacterium]|nr:hypothetical protein [Deltaproteobacteria bacterium]